MIGKVKQKLRTLVEGKVEAMRRMTLTSSYHTVQQHLLDNGITRVVLIGDHQPDERLDVELTGQEIPPQALLLSVLSFGIVKRAAAKVPRATDARSRYKPPPSSVPLDPAREKVRQELFQNLGESLERFGLAPETIQQTFERAPQTIAAELLQRAPFPPAPSAAPPPRPPEAPVEVEPGAPLTQPSEDVAPEDDVVLNKEALRALHATPPGPPEN